MEHLIRQLTAYNPWNEQERADAGEMLRLLHTEPDLFLRTNKTAHMTASAWVVDKEREHVLMVYHNLYRSWSWTGGHADGEHDLLAAAMREVREETGIKKVNPVFTNIYSLEILTVDGHVKKGIYVPPHLHLNLTFLLEADRRETLRCKEDENSGAAWFGLEEAVEASTEPWIRENIYKKLNAKLKIHSEGKFETKK